jgi:hypothetical protein
MLALPHRSPLRAVATFLIFVFVGPPIGLLMAAATFEPGRITGLLNLATIDSSRATRLAMFNIMLSYMVGGIPATLVGLVAAVTQYRSRMQRAPLRVVLLASLVTALIFFVVFFSYPPFWQQPAFLITVLALVIGVHLAAGFVCWLIVNGLLRLSGSREAQATP